MCARESIIPAFVPHCGCSYHCVFCNQRQISGAKKPASPDDVRRAVQSALALLPSGSKPQLAFYGGSFTAIPVQDQEALLAAAKEFLDSGLISSIRLSTRPDAVDEAVLSRLHGFGVETVELGAQSMCDEVLALSGRGHTSADVEYASRLIKASGFRLILQMMTGLPGDSPERSIRTAEKIIALRPDGVRIYPTVIVRDTMLYDLWQSGQYTEHTVEDAVSLCARLLPMFEKASIPVIRLGLNPTEELSAGGAAAGAYHPALGELVKSRMLRSEAEKRLAGIVLGSRVCLFVHPKKLSQMAGQHKCNITYLQEKFNLSGLSVCPDPALSEQEICIKTDRQ